LIPGGHNWLDLRISDYKMNVADAALTVPDSVRNAPAPQVQVVKTQLAPGVVLMGGGSHNSVAVEFKDFVTVIEGPLNQQRSLAVIAEVKRTFPGKPIRCNPILCLILIVSLPLKVPSGSPIELLMAKFGKLVLETFVVSPARRKVPDRPLAVRCV
jgi:hypothetical protein